MLSQKQKGHLALFFAQVIYAMNYSIAKDIVPNYLHPFSLTFLRIFGACLMFWSLTFILPPVKQSIERKDLKKIFYLSLFGIVINQVFFIWGLSITTPINSAIIMISNPIAVFILSLFITTGTTETTSFSWKKMIGLSLGILGALTLILFKGNFSFGSDTWAGDVMTLCNSISWAIFLIYGKSMLQKYHTVAVMKWLFLFGTLLLLPFFFTNVLSENWQHIPMKIWLSIAFVVIATTFFAYLLNLYGLKLLSTSVVSMYIYIQPFLATIFAVLLGKDEINSTKILAGSFVLLGIYLVNSKR